MLAKFWLMLLKGDISNILASMTSILFSWLLIIKYYSFTFRGQNLFAIDVNKVRRVVETVLIDSSHHATRVVNIIMLMPNFRMVSGSFYFN